MGIEVAHSKKGICISQQKHITGFLQETNKIAYKPASATIDPNVKLQDAD
jgi:hypothetical protein